MPPDLPSNSAPMPAGPITGAAAWVGPQLARHDDWIVRLGANEIAEIDAALRHFKASGAAPQAIGRASFPLPTLAPKLDALPQELLEGRGFVMLRGFPVHRYDLESAAIAYLGLGRHLGSLRSSKGRGHLLGHVKDVGADISDGNTRFYQTSPRLEYHTDSADLVGLLCLASARSGGESFLASSVTLYKQILERRPDLLPAVFAPRYGGITAGDRGGIIVPGTRLSVSLRPE